MKSPRKAKGSRNACTCGKHRSGFECRSVASYGPEYAYECVTFPYTTQHNYLPDLVDVNAKRIVEFKGIFDTADRAKMLAIKKAYPDWTITMVFQNPNLKIGKKSKTTYSRWCDKHGIKWKS